MDDLHTVEERLVMNTFVKGILAVIILVVGACLVAVFEPLSFAMLIVLLLAALLLAVVGTVAYILYVVGLKVLTLTAIDV